MALADDLIAGGLFLANASSAPLNAISVTASTTFDDDGDGDNDIDDDVDAVDVDIDTDTGVNDAVGTNTTVDDDADADDDAVAVVVVADADDADDSSTTVDGTVLVFAISTDVGELAGTNDDGVDDTGDDTDESLVVAAEELDDIFDCCGVCVPR